MASRIGPPLTPDEEREVEKVLIHNSLHGGTMSHDPDDCKRDEERVICEECGACLCDDGDHYYSCSFYVH